MISFPGAKINIGLKVEGKRQDGYHNICSYMVPIPFYDILEIVTSDQDSFTYSGISFDFENDLCKKVLEKLRAFLTVPAIQCHLHKQIPVGSGMAGGTSNAVSFYLMLSSLFSLEIPFDKHLEILEFIGMDARFFERNQAALATEKGNTIQVIDWNPPGKYLFLLKIEKPISTKWAYDHVQVTHHEKELDIYQRMPVNDFENIVFERHVELKALKKMFDESGAKQFGMTGSGPTLYGFYDQKPDAFLWPSHLWIKCLELK